MKNMDAARSNAAAEGEVLLEDIFVARIAKKVCVKVEAMLQKRFGRHMTNKPTTEEDDEDDCMSSITGAVQRRILKTPRGTGQAGQEDEDGPDASPDDQTHDPAHNAAMYDLDLQLGGDAVPQLIRPGFLSNDDGKPQKAKPPKGGKAGEAARKAAAAEAAKAAAALPQTSKNAAGVNLPAAGESVDYAILDLGLKADPTGWLKNFLAGGKPAKYLDGYADQFCKAKLQAVGTDPNAITELLDFVDLDIRAPKDGSIHDCVIDEPQKVIALNQLSATGGLAALAGVGNRQGPLEKRKHHIQEIAFLQPLVKLVMKLEDDPKTAGSLLVSAEFIEICKWAKTKNSAPSANSPVVIAALTNMGVLFERMHFAALDVSDDAFVNAVAYCIKPLTPEEAHDNGRTWFHNLVVKDKMKTKPFYKFVHRFSGACNMYLGGNKALEDMNLFVEAKQNQPLEVGNMKRIMEFLERLKSWGKQTDLDAAKSLLESMRQQVDKNLEKVMLSNQDLATQCY